jgi:hypothetical protein
MTRIKIGWKKKKDVYEKGRLRLRLRLRRRNRLRLRFRFRGKIQEILQAFLNLNLSLNLAIPQIIIALKYAPLIIRPPQVKGAAGLSGMKSRYLLRQFHPLFLCAPPAARGKAHGAWRLAHSVNCIIRFALCALRFARIPLQKLLIKVGFPCHVAPESLFDIDGGS